MKFLPALALLLLTGCAAIERNELRQQAIWLEKAGFRVVDSARPPTADPGRSTMILRASSAPGGRISYKFLDPASGRAYIGGPAELAAYETIVSRDRARRAADFSRMTPGSTRIHGPMVW